MKKLLVLALLTLTTSVTYAQEKMKVVTNNGNTTEFLVDDIREVTFEGPVPPPPAQNCKLIPNEIVYFSDGFVTNWTVGDNVYLSYMTVLTKSYFDSFGNDEDKIVNEILSGNTPRSFVDKITNLTDNQWFEPSKKYVLCTISYNSNGERGELVTREFETLSNTLPLAEISGISATSGSSGNIWRWDVTLKNNATSYYLGSWQDETLYNYDEHILAWLLHVAIDSGAVTAKYSYDAVQTSRSGNMIAVCTWAVNVINNIGNYHVGKFSLASARVMAPSKVGTGKREQPRWENVDIDKGVFDKLQVVKFEGQ